MEETLSERLERQRISDLWREGRYVAWEELHERTREWIRLQHPAVDGGAWLLVDGVAYPAGTAPTSLPGTGGRAKGGR